MLDVFRGLKNLIKVNYVHIDSPVFRLHYSITVILLIAFSLIVTTRQYVGNPIDCIHTKDIPEDVLNTYCWIHSTYTLKSFFKKKVGVEVPYPGIGNSRESGREDMADRKYYKYYQWVCFCLFFQVSLVSLAALCETSLLCEPDAFSLNCRVIVKSKGFFIDNPTSLPMSGLEMATCSSLFLFFLFIY